MDKEINSVQPKKQKMNLPNRLTVLRMCLVPVFMAVMLLPIGKLMPDSISAWLPRVIAAVIFIVSSLTDMLDGKIARKYNLVTDFGKFIDPLADKFMVLSSMISILVWMLLRDAKTLALVFVWVVLVILLRELGVTSLRLVVAGKSGIVVAASIFGKIKTVSQMVGTVLIILEPAFPMVFDNSVISYIADNHIISYIAMAVMTFTTIFSGIDYLKAYMPYIDSNK